MVMWNSKQNKSHYSSMLIFTFNSYFCYDAVMGKLCREISKRGGGYSAERFLQHPLPFPWTPLSGKLDSTGASQPYFDGLPWWLRGYRFCLQCGSSGFNPWVGKIPRRREWQWLQYSCQENSTDRGYSPRNCKKLDTTEQLTLSHCASAHPQIAASGNSPTIYIYF